MLDIGLINKNNPIGFEVRQSANIGISDSFLLLSHAPHPNYTAALL